MNSKILNLTPKRYICPYCGKKHKWVGLSLKTYSSEFHTSFNICTEALKQEFGGNPGCYELFISDGSLHYFVGPICCQANIKVDRKIKISSIIESKEEPLVYFNVPIRTENEIKKEGTICSDCKIQNKCRLLRLAEKGSNRDFIMTLGFEFDPKDFESAKEK